jgi:hypothetical protein
VIWRVGYGFSALQAERIPSPKQSAARHSKAIPATACILFIVIPFLFFIGGAERCFRTAPILLRLLEFWYRFQQETETAIPSSNITL